MVVCGIPVPDKRHAKAIATQGLEMIVAAGEVPSPATGDPLQVKRHYHLAVFLYITCFITFLSLPKATGLHCPIL